MKLQKKSSETNVSSKCIEIKYIKIKQRVKKGKHRINIIQAYSAASIRPRSTAAV